MENSYENGQLYFPKTIFFMNTIQQNLYLMELFFQNNNTIEYFYQEIMTSSKTVNKGLQSSI